MRTKRHTLTWKRNYNLKVDKNCGKKLKMMLKNVKKRSLNWNKKIKSRKVNRSLINLLSNQIHWTKQQYKTKTIPKSIILFFEIIFWFKQGWRGGGSRRVDIIIRGVILNEDVWLQRGEAVRKSGEKWLRNMLTLLL